MNDDKTVAWLLSLSRKELQAKVREMIGLLNEGDSKDMFGTEGWQHRLGWED